MFKLNYSLFIKTCILCIYYQISTTHSLNKQIPLTYKLSTLQCEKNTSFIYNKSGKLQCKLITKRIQYFDNTKTTHIIQPNAILFNNNKIPTWNIQAQEAKITCNNIMYLHGNVQIINLIKHSHLRSITTNSATLNLTTYDIFSNEKTTIHGTQFNTVAMNMKGNLKKKFTTLSEKVYTLYETKNSKKI